MAEMDVWVYVLLHAEVEWQTRIALTAHDDMQAALQSNDRPRFWYATQAFLSAAAMVSKLLTGSPRSKDAHAERERLKERLRVSDDSPLLDRELRNHFEHYDERIIKLAQEHPNEGGVDAHIGHPDEAGRVALVGGAEPWELRCAQVEHGSRDWIDAATGISLERRKAKFTWHEGDLEILSRDEVDEILGGSDDGPRGVT